MKNSLLRLFVVLSLVSMSLLTLTGAAAKRGARKLEHEFSLEERTAIQEIFDNPDTKDGHERKVYELRG